MESNVWELKQKIKIMQRKLEIIQGSKTYRLWQAYCLLRKIAVHILENSFKRILIPSRKKNSRYIKFLSQLPTTNTVSDVSIVIPTYNGQATFPYLLKAATSQINLNHPEIVVIDSGSSDNTLLIARKFNAVIKSIKKEEFNHGLTRNLGAKLAKGKYIIFTVQDAIPLNNKTYSNLLTLLTSKDNIVACSTRQVPYPDADLFAEFQVKYHNSSLQLNNTNFISTFSDNTNFYQLPYMQKRQISLFDDVCSAVKRKEFLVLGGYKKMSFGEDIDFSIRALHKGYKIGFTGESGVIHSHTRSVFYFLKRCYADYKIVFSLLKEKQGTPFNSLDEIILEVMNSYLFINKLIDHVPDLICIPNYSESLSLVNEYKTRNIYTHSEFMEVLLNLSKMLNLSSPLKGTKKESNRDIFEQSRSIYNSASQLIDFTRYEKQILKEFIGKLFTIILGSHLVLLTMKLKNVEKTKTERILDSVLLKII